MILWIMVFIGILIFALGLYFLVKNYKDGRYIKRYGYISYIGFSMILLGGILLMEPVFTRLPGNFSNSLPWGIAMVACIIASSLLLKPRFLRGKK